jgi:hypothetical protein
MLQLLDVSIGVALLYSALALFVTTVQELIASIFAARAKRLYDVLAEMLAGHVPAEGNASKPLVQALYEHPLLQNLARGRHLPSYIPSRAFAIALIDVLRGTKTASDALGAGELLAGAAQFVDRVSDPQLKRVLKLLVADAQQLASTVDERSRLVSERLEGWFNDRMARASGWYKRSAQLWSLGLALALAVAMNADSVHLVQTLWADAALREAAVATAREGRPLSELALPIGWQVVAAPTTVGGWLLRACGWLATAVAVSLGATFWFDVLNRALRFRATGARVVAATGRVETPAPEVAL